MTVPLEVGAEIPAVIRSLGPVALVAYAGATWDWHRLHHDHAWISERELPGTVVDGQLFGALIVEQVQDAFGPACRPVRLMMRFNAMVFAGETVTVSGEIIAISTAADGLIEVTVRHEIRSDAGTVAVRDAQSVSVMPVPIETEQVGGR
jgi:acyl dehydratase